MTKNIISTKSRLARFGGAALTAALTGALLTGCASTDSAGANQSAGSVSTAPAVLVQEAWVKAGTDGMTSGFAELKNTTEKNMELVSVSSDAATDVELHDMIGSGGAMSMEPLDGPLVIPAHSSVNLEPGGKHIMFMNLTQELKAGTTITVVLNFADQSTQSVDFDIKDFSGAKESYAPAEDHGSH
ncbi:copper chaperone PCu(A)C [Arthrobacter sp. MYb227]|uniref:copper chaperone PCu(A)C n=1 Tax=Arthrobacter sp. MYb227 TaxID=1848601 RepID=UPI0015E462CA|nr:copper chaperone PCu(A)C [Arthrobacter sp. MYb227]